VISSEFVRGEETVSFVEFGQWYNASGHVFVPWIELLDVNKWPDVLSDGLDASYGEDTSDEDYVPGEDEDEDDDDDDDEDDEEEEEEEDDNGADDEEEEGEEEEDDSAPEGLDDVSDPPVFLFALPPSSSTAKLSRADMSGAIDVLNTCGINGQKVSDVATALTPLLGTGVVASSRFDDAVSSLLSVSKFGDAEADKITSFFSRVYFAVSSVCDGEPTADRLAVAIALFAGGSKSEKLSFAFKRLCTDQAGASPADLSKYLSSFLAPLLSMSASVSAGGVDAFRRKVLSTVDHVVGVVFATVGGSPARVTFAQFGQWYNVDGHTVVPWIELLDVRKWKSIADR